jgi:ubiquinone/menaquinone biosynthesis C-methylase UbiE
MKNSMSKKISKLELILFGLKIGFYSLIRGNFKIAFKRILLPINYWRVTIFSIVANYILNLNFNNITDIKILDIGSPKLLSLFLSSQLNCKIFSTDLQDKSLFTEWEKHFHNMPNKKDNIIFEFANAKILKYPDKYFDIIYTLSVLNIITPAEDGDVLALKEIQKKIKPGGLLIIEVGYREKYNVNYAHTKNFEEYYCGKPLFRERQYDNETLQTRIEKNIPGVLMEKIFLYEKLPFDYIWNILPKFITTLFAFIEPWADVLNISIAQNTKQKNRGRSVILIFKIRG